MTFFRGEGCFYIKTKIWNIWWQKSLQVSYSVCDYQNYIFKNNYRYLSVAVSTVIKMLCIPFKDPSEMSFPSLGQGLSISYTAVWHTFEQMYQTMFSTCIDMEEYILFGLSSRSLTRFLTTWLLLCNKVKSSLMSEEWKDS